MVEYPNEYSAEMHAGTVRNLSTQPVFRIEFSVVLMDGTRPLPAAHMPLLTPGAHYEFSYGDDLPDDLPEHGVVDYVEADFPDAARVPWRVNSDGHVMELSEVGGEPLNLSDGAPQAR